VPAKRATDRELEQRHPIGDQIANCCVALAQPKVARVEPVRLDGHEGLRGEPLVLFVVSLAGSVLPGGVSVEGKYHLAAKLAGVHQQPPQNLDVLNAEGGSAGRHRGRHPRHVTGHHIGVALDDHRLPTPLDVLLGRLDPIQQLALLVDRRLGRIDVLGLDPVVVEQPSGTEADDVAANVVDRPDQPPHEPVQQSARTFPGESGPDQFRIAELTTPQMTNQRVPGPRGEPDAELPRGSRVESSLGQELTSRGGLMGLGEQAGVELGGGDVRGHQPGPSTLRTVRNRAALLVTQRYPGPARQPLDRLGEAEVVGLHDEVDDVATHAAAEAVEVAARRADVERWGLLLVERAQPLQRAPTGVAQAHLGTDHVGDRRSFPNQSDVLVLDPPGSHGGSLFTNANEGSQADRAFRPANFGYFRLHLVTDSRVPTPSSRAPMSAAHDVLIETRRHQRALTRRTANGLTDEQVSAHSTVSSLSVGGIVKHPTQVEPRWSEFILKGPEVFGGFTAESFAAHEAGLVMTPRSASPTCLPRSGGRGQ
jgi:hypothetical protein